MQGIFVNQTRPQYMNYGSFGFIIGHELTHAFDNDSRKYDGEGYLMDWWEPEADKEFLSKSECLVHQYGNYTVEEVKKNIKGEKTLSENIADNGEVKVAYLAYEEYMKTHSPDLLLPGAKFYATSTFLD
ncbi:neprilysin-2-like [Leptopilina heterotoma]|uniref:neprilysin-2-like n=1 Tax=Leptopilina heterotoma TaxID=63436 RepID=UPI001CA9C0C2|nr:neprilysin-2-like [Leptopilina heterotoma]XP_043465932.1 neprilysin-2-like [Leptopilina heterotoma]